MMQQDRFKAVVAVHVFLIQDGLVLLQRRANTGYEDGNYSVPAGHLDGGETVTDAAARELYEETGLVAKTSDFAVVHTMHRQVIDSDGHRHERIDFFCSVAAWQGEPRIAEPEKCDDLIWSHLQQLPNNTVAYIREALTSFCDQNNFSQFGWKDAA